MGRKEASRRGTHASSPRYRTAADLVVYWQDGRLVLNQYAARRKAEGSLLVLQILDLLQKEQDLERLRARLPGVEPGFLRRVLREMVRLRLVEGVGAPGRRPRRGGNAWGPWAPEAAFFHFATRDQPRAGGAALERLEAALRRKARTEPPPAPVRRYPRAPRICLPSRPLEGEFASVVLSRRTWRGFSRRPVDASQLGALLDLSFGVRFWGRGAAGERVAFRTSPSSGARQALEAYVLALRVEGVPRGLYHYAADEKALELLRPGATSRQLLAYLEHQWWYRRAAAVVFMSAVLPRSRWRYPFPRAYRSLLLEAGHFCQTFLLAATWLGLAPFCTAALADTRIERDLGLDGIDEVVLYAAGIGSRPRTREGFVQWPSHRRRHPYLENVPQGGRTRGRGTHIGKSPSGGLRCRPSPARTSRSPRPPPRGPWPET